MLPGEIGFIARLGLLSGLREQELIYIKQNEVCNIGYGCESEKLHLVNCKNGMTIMAIGWTKGNKKALATILIIKINLLQRLVLVKSMTISNYGKININNTQVSYSQKNKGTFITKWGSYGTADGQFFLPHGIAVDSSRNVYVADTGNNRIQVFAPSR